MKKIFSFLVMGFVMIASALQADGTENNLLNDPRYDDAIMGFDIGADESNLDLRRHGRCDKDSNIRSLGRAFGFATYPPRISRHKFLSSKEVILKKLPVSSQRVSLSHGCLKLEKGIYRFAYGVNLKNTGSGGMISTWLTLKPSHVHTGVIIPISEIDEGVLPPLDGIGFSVVQICGNIFFNVPETSLICLNYSTSGDVSLSQLPHFDPSCGSSSDRTFNKAPNAFYLLAVKLANISN